MLALMKGKEMSDARGFWTKIRQGEMFLGDCGSSLVALGIYRLVDVN